MAFTKNVFHIPNLCDNMNPGKAITPVFPKDKSCKAGSSVFGIASRRKPEVIHHHHRFFTTTENCFVLSLF